MSRRRLVFILLLVFFSLGLASYLLYGVFSRAEGFVSAESRQSVPTIQQLGRLPANENKILVLYKRHCSNCKKYDDEVVEVLEPYGDKVMYLDIEDYVPPVVSIALSSNGSENVSTPYVAVVQSAPPSVYIPRGISITDSSSLEELSSYLKSEFG